MDSLLSLKQHMKDHIRHTQQLADFRASIRFLGLDDVMLSRFMKVDPSDQAGWSRLLCEVEKEIDRLCAHEWTHDEVDIDPDTSKHVVFCRRCLSENHFGNV